MTRPGDPSESTESRKPRALGGVGPIALNAIWYQVVGEGSQNARNFRYRDSSLAA